MTNAPDEPVSVSLFQGKAEVRRGPAPHGRLLGAFADTPSLARFLAGVAHREGAPVFEELSHPDPRVHHARWLDRGALAEAMEAEAEAYRAGDGWRVHGTAGEYTFWTSGGIFQANRGELPANESGYPDLAWLLRAKNVPAGGFRPAEGLDAEVRALRTADFEGKPAWNGIYRRGEGWETAGSLVGAIAYASPEAARAGAKVCLEEAMAATPSPGRPR